MIPFAERFIALLTQGPEKTVRCEPTHRSRELTCETASTAAEAAALFGCAQVQRRLSSGSSYIRGADLLPVKTRQEIVHSKKGNLCCNQDVLEGFVVRAVHPHEGDDQDQDRYTLLDVVIVGMGRDRHGVWRRDD